MTAPGRSTAAALLLLSLSGCVSRSAGYDDVRSLVDARGGGAVQWNQMEGRRNADETTSRLLAKPLTADGAAQVALLNNPAMQIAFEELGIARARLVSALAIPNPVAEGGLGFSGGGAAPDIRVGVHESITGLLFISPKESVADAELDAVKLQVAGAALDLAYRARTEFYRYQAAEQILELRTTVLRAANASFELSHRLYEAGNITELQFLSEKALYEEARIAMAQAETSLRSAREELDATLGLWGRRTPWKTAGRLREPGDDALSTQRLEQRALERSLDLEAVAKGFTAAARRANLASVMGAVPDLAAGVEVEREDDEWEVGPSVELGIPLFYQGQGETDEAEAMMRRQRHEYAATALRIRAAARSAAMRMESVRERSRYLKDVLIPLRKRITDETLLMYNAMSTGPAEVLVAKRDQVETGRMYVEALRDYWLARAEVEQLLAGRLPTTMGAMSPITEPERAPPGGGGGH